MKKSIKLDIKPKWDEIEKARGRSSKFFVSHGLSDETVYALTMVMSELIENSIKYGNFISPGHSAVVVNIHINRKDITIEVSNPVNEENYHNLERLDKTIQWIRGYQDPFEAYVERLKEVAKKPLNDEESGLGLARVAYEGNAILDFFVDEAAQLSVSAVSNY